jgi:hypothetical protein
MIIGHFDGPVYWQMPNDGADFKCDDCEERFSHKLVIIVQVPKDDSRRVLCLDCVDSDWLERAKNLGMFPL